MSQQLTYHGVHITHPGARERTAGHRSRIYLALTLPSGSIREVDLNDDQLLELIATASKHLRVRLARSAAPE